MSFSKVFRLFERKTATLPMSAFGLRCVAEGVNPSVDIVFVHGLRGHRESTWTKDGKLWPADLLPRGIPEARILLFGYDSSVVSRSPGKIAKTDVRSDASSLRSELTAQRSRDPETQNRPIIIIAHSLGGLVAAQLFNDGEQGGNDSDAKSVVKNIRGMIFMGTPFAGSEVARPAEAVRQVLELMGSETQEQTLKMLGVDSDSVRNLTQTFSSLLRKRRDSKKSEDQIIVFFFYETLTTSIGRLKNVMVVQQRSACLPACGDATPIEADHHNICKFSSETDAGYVKVVAAIRKVLAPPKRNEEGETGSYVTNYGTLKAQNIGNVTISGNQVLNLY